MRARGSQMGSVPLSRGSRYYRKGKGKAPNSVAVRADNALSSSSTDTWWGSSNNSKRSTSVRSPGDWDTDANAAWTLDPRGLLPPNLLAVIVSSRPASWTVILSTVSAWGEPDCIYWSREYWASRPLGSTGEESSPWTPCRKALATKVQILRHWNENTAAPRQNPQIQLKMQSSKAKKQRRPQGQLWLDEVNQKRTSRRSSGTHQATIYLSPRTEAIPSPMSRDSTDIIMNI